MSADGSLLMRAPPWGPPTGSEPNTEREAHVSNRTPTGLSGRIRLNAFGSHKVQYDHPIASRHRSSRRLLGVSLKQPSQLSDDQLRGNDGFDSRDSSLSTGSPAASSSERLLRSRAGSRGTNWTRNFFILNLPLIGWVGTCSRSESSSESHAKTIRRPRPPPATLLDLEQVRSSGPDHHSRGRSDPRLQAGFRSENPSRTMSIGTRAGIIAIGKDLEDPVLPRSEVVEKIH